MGKLRIDKYVFQWIRKQLTGATPEQIVAFNDILKLHNKIIKLAGSS